MTKNSKRLFCKQSLPTTIFNAIASVAIWGALEGLFVLFLLVIIPFIWGVIICATLIGLVLAYWLLAKHYEYYIFNNYVEVVSQLSKIGINKPQFKVFWKDIVRITIPYKTASMVEGDTDYFVVHLHLNPQKYHILRIPNLDENLLGFIPFCLAKGIKVEFGKKNDRWLSLMGNFDWYKDIKLI